MTLSLPPTPGLRLSLVNVLQVAIMTIVVCVVCQIGGLLRGKWVVTPRMKGVTMADPSPSEPEPLPESVTADCLKCILRARRIEPADTIGHRGGNEAFVGAKDCCRHFDQRW